MKYLISTDVYLDGILSDWKKQDGVFLIENEEGIKKTIKIWSENLDNIVLMSSLKIDWENEELTFLYTDAWCNPKMDADFDCEAKWYLFKTLEI